MKAIIPQIKTFIDVVMGIDKVKNGRLTTLTLLQEGRITPQEAESLLSGLQNIQINVQHLAVDNSVKDNSCWGTIIAAGANGNVAQTRS